MIGILIAAIVLYTATLEHARDFAVMKAVGARFQVLARVAVAQAGVLTIGGFFVGCGRSALLVLAFRTLLPVVDSIIDGDIVVKMVGMVLVANLLATIQPLPISAPGRPQEVFKA